MITCSVCGKKVNVDKNMITEHKDSNGNKCYGSFTPTRFFNPFFVKQLDTPPEIQGYGYGYISYSSYSGYDSGSYSGPNYTTSPYEYDMGNG